MASIILVDVHHCGGVIIDNIHVVTAAHCVLLEYPFEVIKVIRA